MDNNLTIMGIIRYLLYKFLYFLCTLYVFFAKKINRALNLRMREYLFIREFSATLTNNDSEFEKFAYRVLKYNTENFPERSVYKVQLYKFALDALWENIVGYILLRKKSFFFEDDGKFFYKTHQTNYKDPFKKYFYRINAEKAFFYYIPLLSAEFARTEEMLTSNEKARLRNLKEAQYSRPYDRRMTPVSYDKKSETIKVETKSNFDARVKKEEEFFKVISEINKEMDHSDLNRVVEIINNSTLSPQDKKKKIDDIQTELSKKEDNNN